MGGKGQIVSVIGVAGVGKSRLVSELKGKEGWKDGRMEEWIGDAAQPSNHPTFHPLWIEGRCLSTGESIGYGAFIDILKSYFQFDGSRSRQDFGDSRIFANSATTSGPSATTSDPSATDENAMAEKIVAAVKALLPQQADDILPLFGNLLSVKFGNELDERLKFASPEQIKHQTFMALRDFFRALAQRQPLILVLEDLHWADSMSLDLIVLLMEMLSQAPLMLICVYRPEQDHKSWRIGGIALSKCLDRYTEIYLRELPPQDSRRMVEELLPIENLSENVKNLILTKSEGNPFFVEEVVRSLIDNEIVYREGEIWKAKAEIESFVIPDTIQNVILSRLDWLSEDAKYVLQCASVIGRLFRHRLLAYTSQRERELDQVLWRLEDRYLIYEERAVPELEYSFKHVLIQETAYQSLLERHRQEFHQKVGEGIEVLYQDRIEEFYEELAYHYDRGDDVEKAVEYLIKAGEKARRTYLNDEAIGYFQRVLERLNGSLLGETRKDLRLAALKGLGQIYHGVGKESEAEERFRQTIALGQKMGLAPRKLARLYSWLGDILWWQSRYDEVIRLGEEGLALLGDDTESVEAALMNNVAAEGYFMKGDGKKWREFTYRNARFLQRLSYSEELLPAYEHAGVVYLFSDKNVEETMKWFQTLERKAEQHHDLRALGMVHLNTGRYILAPSGDLHGAISQYQRGLELFTKIGGKHRGWCLGYMGETFLSLGDLQKAEEFAYKELEIQERVGEKWGRARSYQTIGIILLCQGSLEKAVDAFQKAEQLFQEIGWAGVPIPLGRAYLAQGKRRESLSQCLPRGFFSVWNGTIAV